MYFLNFESGKSAQRDPQSFWKTCFRPPLRQLEEFCMQKIAMLQMPVTCVIGVMGFVDNVKNSTFEKVKIQVRFLRKTFLNCILNIFIYFKIFMKLEIEIR